MRESGRERDSELERQGERERERERKRALHGYYPSLPVSEPERRACVSCQQ